jgi:hypothetical protein
MTTFWTRVCAMAIVGIMVCGGLLVVTSPLEVGAVAGRDDVNYTNFTSKSSNLSIVAPGDRGIRPQYRITNSAPVILSNVTSRAEGVMDVQDPFVWKTKDTTQKYNISASSTSPSYYTGIEYEVSDTVTVGFYTVTFWTSYDYIPVGDNRSYHNEERDTLVIEIRSILSPPSTIAHYYDSTSLPPSTKSRLYAGESFQKMGFSAPTSTMFSGRTVDGNRIQATLVDRGGVDYSGLVWNERAATSANITQYSYFFFRLTIDQSKNAGRYDYTLELKYTRKDASTGNEPILIRESTVISLMIDFTPMMEIFSGGTYSIAQGTSQLPLTVMLRNTGNCDLARLNVWLDIDNYFTIHGGSYYDGEGYRTNAGTEAYIDHLPKGVQQPVYFLLDTFEYIPAGEHRLPLRYSGYCYDDGSYTYSDWKATSDSDYSSIKGENIYVTVNVSDPSMDVTAEVTASFSLAHQMRDVSVPVTIMNKEAVGYGDVSLRLSCFPRTSPSTTIFSNPLNPASRTLEDVTLLSLPAQSSAQAYFRGDLSTSARPGSYELELNFTATDLNSGLQVAKTMVVSVRVMPGPPEIVMTASYEQLYVKPGKEFQLDVQLENAGQDAAHDVLVELLFPNGRSSGYIVSGDRADAYTIEGMLNPFSVGTSRVAVGDIASAAVLGKNFTVYADRNMAKSKAYPITIVTTYQDADGTTHNASTDIYVTASGSPPAKAAQPDPIAAPLTLGAILIVLIWVLFLVGAIIVKKIGGPGAARLRSSAPNEPPVQSPPPSGPAYAPAQPQYFPSSPAPTTAAPPPSPPQPVEGLRPCRKCGAPVASGSYICPNCGSPV